MTLDHNQRPVALVTGASRGLGAILARFLAGAGYDLVLTARGDDALQNTARELTSYGGRVTALAGDIQNEAHRAALIDAANALGGLNLLINNASSLGESPLPPLSEYPLDAFANLFAVNVLAQLGLAQAALPLLKQRSGLIIQLSSDAARGGYEGWGAYGATKAALDLISLTMANELKSHGVAVVSVDPGDMQTVMHQDAFPGEDISDRPQPDVTLPFWAWLFGQPHDSITGQRFQAQAETWTVPS